MSVSPDRPPGSQSVPSAEQDGQAGVALREAPASASTATGPQRPARGARLLAFLRARPMLAASLIYAVLSIAMVGQGLLPGRALSASDFLWNDAPWQASRPASVVGIGANYELVDTAEVFQPFLRYTKGVLPGIPLWNPYISAGRPYLANAQSAVFSPFSIPAYVLPFLTSLAVIAAFKLFFAALGTYALARRLGMRFGGALLAGLVFAFGTFFIVLLAWPETNIFPLLPWTLLLADMLVTAPGLLPGAGLAAVVALTYLGGHPETTFHVVFAAVVFFAFRLLVWMRAQRAPPRSLLRPLLAFAVALGVGTAMAAVMIIPFVELLAHSNEYARRLSAGVDHWPRKYFGGLFLHDYWGRATQQSNIEPFMQLRGWYAGALTLMLAPVALLIRPTLTRIGVAVFAAFSVVMVLGIPPIFNLVVKFPGFSSTHNEPMIIYFLLCLGLLAGWGLDELSSRRLDPRMRKLVLLGGLGIFCVPLVWMTLAKTLTGRGLWTAFKVAWLFATPPQPITPGDTAADIVRMSSLFQWLVLAGVGLVLIYLRLRRSQRPLSGAVFVGAAVLLLTVDLFRANMGFNPAIPRSNAVVPTTGAIRYLQAQRPNRFVGASTSTAFEPLPADLAMNFHLYDARGYDYPTEARYDTLWRTAVNNAPTLSQPTELAGISPLSLRALNLLSVSDVLTSPGEKPLTEPGLQPVYRGRDATVYTNSGALPRVFMVDRQHVVGGAGAALAAATAPGFDGRRVAITEHPVPGIAQDNGTAAPAPGSARLVSYGAENISIDATAQRPSLLVLTDVYYPGWTVTVDGHSAPIERVDYLLRGVPISAGTHRIEFRYQPASFTAGWIISLISTLAVIAAAVVGWRRRREAGERAGGAGGTVAGAGDGGPVPGSDGAGDPPPATDGPRERPPPATPPTR